jgi:hypothetical protein
MEPTSLVTGVRTGFHQTLSCASSGEGYDVRLHASAGGLIHEGPLESRCEQAAPVIGGVPRVLPQATAHTLVAEHADFYGRHAQLLPSGPT